MLVTTHIIGGEPENAAHNTYQVKRTQKYIEQQMLDTCPRGGFFFFFARIPHNYAQFYHCIRSGNVIAKGRTNTKARVRKHVAF